MLDHYKIDLRILERIKTSFISEKRLYFEIPYDEIKKSYLASCSNFSVSLMNNTIDLLFKKIESGYTNIEKWYTFYIGDAYNLDVSLKEGKVGYVKDPDLSLYLSKFINKNNVDIPKLSEIACISGITETKSGDSDAGGDKTGPINIPEFEPTPLPIDFMVDIIKIRFGIEDEDIDSFSIDYDNDVIRIRLKNGAEYIFKDGELIDILGAPDYVKDAIMNLISDFGVGISDIGNVVTFMVSEGDGIYIKTKDGNEYVYDLDGILVKVTIDGVEYTAEEYYIKLMSEDEETYVVDEDEVKRIAEEYGESEEWAIYYLRALEDENLKKLYSNDEELVELVDKMAKRDKENGYSILTHTAVLCEGEMELGAAASGDTVHYEGQWYRMYNEYGLTFEIPLKKVRYISEKDENGNTVVIAYEVTEETITEDDAKAYFEYYQKLLKEMEKYPDYYLDKVLDQLKNVYFVTYTDDSKKGFAGFINQEHGYTVIDVGNNAGDPYGISAFHHELGHAFDHRTDISDTSGWLEICEQLKKLDPDCKLLRKYAIFNDPWECFADVISEYYNTDGTGSDFCSPDDLKELKINYKGYTNLYDYIDDLVNGRLSWLKW